MAKTGCTSCTNCTISFEVRGFQMRTHLLQRHFIFLNLFQLKTLCAFNMHHPKPHTKISTLSDFICLHFFFACVLCLLHRNHGYSSSLNRVLGSALTLKGGIS